MFFCSKFFGQKGKYDRHTKHCTGISGITYSFNTENLVTFKQRLCSENDFTFVAYCDFETSTKVQYDIENHVAYPVSYVLPWHFTLIRIKEVLVILSIKFATFFSFREACFRIGKKHQRNT